MCLQSNSARPMVYHKKRSPFCRWQPLGNSIYKPVSQRLVVLRAMYLSHQFRQEFKKLL